MIEPGVHRQRAERPEPLRAVRCDIAAFVGIASRGPIGVPVAVESWREFEATFGGLDAQGHLPFAVRGFFENGGGRCHVVRVADTAPGGAATAATALLDTTDVSVGRLVAASPGAWGNSLEVRLTEVRRVRTAIRKSESDVWRLVVESVMGIEPGALLAIPTMTAGTPILRIVDAVEPTGSALVLREPLSTAELVNATRVERLTYRIDVRQRGRQAATYDDLSPSPSSPRYGARVLSAGGGGAVDRGLSTPLVAWLDDRDPRSGPIRLKSSGWSQLAGGADGLASLSADDFIGEDPDPSDDDANRRRRARGIAALVEVDEVALIAIPDLFNSGSEPLPPAQPRCPVDRCDPFGTADPPARAFAERPRPLTPSESQRVQRALIEHCESLRDRIAVLDPPPAISDPLTGNETLQQWRSQMTSPYAVAYTPWLEVTDPNPLARRPTVQIPPCGHVLGLVATNDRVHGVHHAPANTELSWIADWSVSYTADEHARHNDNGINVLRAPTDGGLRIFGARTLTYEIPWIFLNVRRLVIFVERSLKRLLAWCVHEPNNEETRAKVRLCTTSFLLSLFERGAFAGATPEESLAVRCDGSNNPPETRDNGNLLVEVFIAPSIPMEFIILRIGRVENSLDSYSDDLRGGVWPR